MLDIKTLEQSSIKAKDEFNHFSRFYDDDLGGATQPNANVYWRTIGYVS